MTEDIWDKLKESVDFYNAEGFIRRRDVRNTIRDLMAEGDKLKEKAEKLEAVKKWWKKWYGCFVDLSTCIPEFVEIMGAEKAGKAVDDSGTDYAKEFRRQADTFEALARLIEQEGIEVTSNFANLLVTRGLAEVCRGLAEMAEKGELEENPMEAEG